MNTQQYQEVTINTSLQKYPGMACPWVADRGDGFHTWRAAVNILNKQSQTANGMGPTAWGLGKGLITPHCKETACYEMLYRALNCNRFFGMA